MATNWGCICGERSDGERMRGDETERGVGPSFQPDPVPPGHPCPGPPCPGYARRNQSDALQDVWDWVARWSLFMVARLLGVNERVMHTSLHIYFITVSINRHPAREWTRSTSLCFLGSYKYKWVSIKRTDSCGLLEK